MNAREQLAEVAAWLGAEDETLSFGLRHSLDALRLFDYAEAHPELSEFVVEWTSAARIEALGYDPLETPEAINGREVETMGASQAMDAMRQARSLLDSVAFVAQEGDTQPVLQAIDDVLLGHTSPAPRLRRR